MYPMVRHMATWEMASGRRASHCRSSVGGPGAGSLPTCEVTDTAGAHRARGGEQPDRDPLELRLHESGSAVKLPRGGSEENNDEQWGKPNGQLRVGL
jgi:hypothetical protein